MVSLTRDPGVALAAATPGAHTGEMTYDEELADRIRFLLEGTPETSERRMFGGIGFMVGGHMAVAANSQGALMVRVDPASGAGWVNDDDVRPMEMQGRTMSGWLSVAASALPDDAALQTWLDRGLAFVATLPPK